MFSALNQEEEQLLGSCLKHPVSVGEYSFIREKGRKSNRTFYYIVKVVEIVEDNFVCEWYELDRSKVSFCQKTAKWGVKEESLLCMIDPPEIFGEGRRKRIIFLKVYKFLTGKDYSEELLK